MAIDIKSPQFPESIFEGTLSNWLKKEGQEIKQDEVLAEIETDKVVIEVTAPSDGIMGKIIINEGSTIKSSEIIGTYDDAKDGKPKEIIEEVEPDPEPEVVQEVSPTPEPVPVVDEAKKPSPVTKKQTSETKKDLKGFRMGPAAKKLLNEKDVPVENIQTSTKKGVITKQDILNAESKSEPSVSGKVDVAKETSSSKRVPMTRLRSVVAKRLLESQSQTASLTTFNEVDLFEACIFDMQIKWPRGLVCLSLLAFGASIATSN